MPFPTKTYLLIVTDFSLLCEKYRPLIGRLHDLIAAANVGGPADVVDTRYAGYQSMRQSRVPQDRMALSNKGGGGVDCGGHLEIHNDARNTDCWSS